MQVLPESAADAGRHAMSAKTESKNTKKSSLWVFLTVLALVLIVIGVACAYLLVGKEKHTSTQVAATYSNTKTTITTTTTATTPKPTTTTATSKPNTTTTTTPKPTTTTTTTPKPTKVHRIFTTQGRSGRFGIIQNFTAPHSGYFLLTALGAGGGALTSLSPPNPGGKGAKVQARVHLRAGQELSIVVGQHGGDFGWDSGSTSSGTGGGGGSFVYIGDELLAAAGGGGGTGTKPTLSGPPCDKKDGFPGMSTEAGGDSSPYWYKYIDGGKNGYGGGAGYSGGGAGWMADGGDYVETGSPDNNGKGGKSREHGWTGGAGRKVKELYMFDDLPKGSAGGFGGGGGGLCCSGGGGGGGYSGGAGGFGCSGGGGGSFCTRSATLCTKTSAANPARDGEVVIQSD